jgi:hypothetical protein
MHKQYAIDAIKLLKQTDETLKSIKKQGFDLTTFTDPFICKIETSIATMLCDGSDSVFDQMLEQIAWWSYDSSEKIIHYKDHQVDVESAEDFINWLMDHYKP